MSLFDFNKNKSASTAKKQTATTQKPADTTKLAELALRTINDGILIVDKDFVVQYLNRTAVDLTGIEKMENALGLDYGTVMKLEMQDGTKVEIERDELRKAIKENKAFESKKYVLASILNEKKTPIKIIMTPTGDGRSNRIITFRDIAKELEEEGAQMEFISTASHEMRTPVASIEGYLGLALNPQTASIDARARQYLESAQAASQRLGNLFKDLLDVTRLEDNRIQVKPVPIELSGFVKKFADEYSLKFKEKNLTYSFGAGSEKSGRFLGAGKVVEQTVYAFVDVDFLGEILANLIENAIKYTPVGGAIWVNVQGDGDKALINVTDTGIGVSAEDLQHIFQKFYRADNSQTRTVGGTGLGLYLVKQRTEAMNGRVWAESAFGEGSTFYVSLPRLTPEEYEKRQIAFQNQRAVQAFAEQPLQQNIAQNAAGTTTIAQTPTGVPPAIQTPQAQVYAPIQVAPVTGVAPSIQPITQQPQPQATQAIGIQTNVLPSAQPMQPAMTNPMPETMPGVTPQHTAQNPQNMIQ